MIATHLRDYVITPTLERIGLHSQAAEELLLGTCAVETNMGIFLHQIRGPARGIFQCEPATETDIWDNWLMYRPQITQRLTQFGIVLQPDDDSIIWNLAYATAMARFHYARVDAKLPHHEDIAGMARYWRAHYNTIKGRGKVEDFINKYNKYILGD